MYRAVMCWQRKTAHLIGQTGEGRLRERVRVTFALECCDREVMSWVATTKGIDAGLVGDLMMQAVERRFGTSETPTKPIEWLTDNGSCYTAAETTNRPTCTHSEKFRTTRRWILTNYFIFRLVDNELIDHLKPRYKSNHVMTSLIHHLCNLCGCRS